MQTHTCRKCQTDRPVSEFYVQDKETGRLNPWCKPCYRDWYRGRAKAPLPDARECKTCGRTFAPRRSNMVYCSAACKSTQGYRRNNPKPDRVCITCGSAIPADRRADVKFCSPRCSVEQRKLDGRHAVTRRKFNLKRSYGMTEADFDALVAKQGGKCAVCGSTDPRQKDGRWCIDHCHDTGAVRGLLCGPCNTGIGQLADDPARLRAAADYLERSRAHA